MLAGYKAYGANGQPVNGALQLSYHITLHQAQYDALSEAEQMADENWFYIDDIKSIGAELDDSAISPAKVWSSQKTNSEIQDVQDQVDINTTDIGTLNSALMWKQIATNVTSLSHDLSQYKEILIDIGFQGNVNHNSIHIITAELSATTHYYSSGYYRTTNDSIGVKVGVNTSGVTGGLVYVDGNTSPIASTFSVYAR